jgi:predicted DNA-binding protein (MmcQ/YjbR family)
VDLDTLTSYARAKPGATHDFPFGVDTLVARVLGKMFALVALDGPPRVNLKCDPDYAEALRATYTAVTPGYHQDHRHWNTVLLDASIPDAEILEMVDQSYALVVKGLTRAQRAQLG